MHWCSGICKSHMPAPSLRIVLNQQSSAMFIISPLTCSRRANCVLAHRWGALLAILGNSVKRGLRACHRLDLHTIGFKTRFSHPIGLHVIQLILLMSFSCLHKTWQVSMIIVHHTSELVLLISCSCSRHARRSSFTAVQAVALAPVRHSICTPDLSTHTNQHAKLDHVCLRKDHIGQIVLTNVSTAARCIV